MGSIRVRLKQFIAGCRQLGVISASIEVNLHNLGGVVSVYVAREGYLNS